jgi:hypothetical protein
VPTKCFALLHGHVCTQLEDEWSSIHWEKVEYMTRIGLRPWWVSQVYLLVSTSVVCEPEV